MEYEYTETDRINAPHTYMYTKYHGKDFLNVYFFNRGKFLEEFAQQSDYIHQALNYFNNPGNFLDSEQDKQSTNYHLTCLIRHILDDRSKNDVYKKISAYTKKYEVSKKLYGTYDTDLKPICDDYETIEPYILLAAACGLYYSKHGNMKFLNCLLKLGDTIVSCKDKIKNSKLKQVAAIAVGLELTLVRQLMGKYGILL